MHNNAIKDIDLKNVPPPTLQKNFIAIFILAASPEIILFLRP